MRLREAISPAAMVARFRFPACMAVLDKVPFGAIVNKALTDQDGPDARATLSAAAAGSDSIGTNRSELHRHASNAAGTGPAGLRALQEKTGRVHEDRSEARSDGHAWHSARRSGRTALADQRQLH